MTTSQTPSGAPAPSGPPSGSGRHSRPLPIQEPRGTAQDPYGRDAWYASGMEPGGAGAPGHGQASGYGAASGGGQAPGRATASGYGTAPSYGTAAGYGTAPGYGSAPGYGQASGHGPDPRGGRAAGDHRPHSGPIPRQPYYEGDPAVPFGGPPYGARTPVSPPAGLPAVPAAAPPAGTATYPPAGSPWPNAARRAAAAPAGLSVPAQQGATGLQPVAMPRNGFGTAALVLGIVGLVFAMIPVIGVVAWPMVILGLLFGVLGLVRVSRGRANNRGVAISGTVLSAIGLIVCMVWAAALGTAVEAASTGAPAPSAEIPAVSGGSEPAAFAGATASDVVGVGGDALTVGDMQISATPLEAGDATFGQTLCSTVTYTNTGGATGSFNGGFDWKLQDPNGAALMTSIVGTDQLLSAGQLAPGGTTSGTVCFDRASGSAGEYVLLYDPMSFSAERGAWLNQVG